MKKTDAISEIYDPVLEIFKSGFKVKIELLGEYLQHKKDLDPTQFLRESKAEARLIQQEGLVKLLELMEIALKEHPRDHPAILASFRLCQEFLNSSQSASWFQSHQIAMQQLTDQLKSECLTSTPIDHALIGFFIHELRDQTAALNTGLLFLEQHPDSQETLNALMRAAHSIKGAARFAGSKGIVDLAHAMEECFTVAKEKKIKGEMFDALLKGIDLLRELACPGDFFSKMTQLEGKIESLAKKIAFQAFDKPDKIKADTTEIVPVEPEPDPVLRITPESLNRLMGLAGESLVEARWLEPFSADLINLGKNQQVISGYLEKLKESIDKNSSYEEIDYYLKKVQEKNKEYAKKFSEHLSELEMFIRRYSSHSDRLQSEVIASRMRPLGDCVEAFPRIVRDLAHKLHKKVRLQIVGKDTLVDREILEKLESPLGHLLRNSIDHGIETPEERALAGKPEEGLIKLEAEHRGGALIITVSDDGKGLDIEELRKDIIKKKLVDPKLGKKLTESELLDYLFLPGFTTSDAVTEISGRGLGLNIVQNVLKEIGGKLQIVIKQGLTIQLQLPLSLSVIRALLVKISDEIYAFPLAAIEAVLLIPITSIQLFDNHQYFKFEGHEVKLIYASQLLDLPFCEVQIDFFSIILLKNPISYYGLIVDSFLEEKELVAQELDPQLDKVTGLSAGALMEDGTPILILDVGNLLLSINLKEH